MMLNDVNSFIFLRSKEGLPILNEYKLGGGNLISLIGQLAILNFLAKIHFVLNKGDKAHATQDKIDKITGIRNASAKLKKYIRVPMLGEMNEQQAFVFLILEYPKDIGIPKEEEKIKKVWNDLRNKISHVATIEVDNIAITFEYSTLDYPQISQPINPKPFRIINPSYRKNQRNKIKREDPDFKNPVSKTMWNLSSDVVFVDFLNLSIQEIAGWIIDKINNDTYQENYLSETKKWIEIHFKSTN